MIKLDCLDVLAKSNRHVDFSLHLDTDVPAEVKRLAGEWLDLHMRGGHGRTSAASLAQQEWWVFSMERQTGYDAANRPLYRLFLGRLAEMEGPADLVGALLALPNKASVDKFEKDGTFELPEKEFESGTKDMVLRAAAELVLGSDVIVRAGPEEAVTLLEGFPQGVVRHVVVFPDRLPAKFPDGISLVVCREKKPLTNDAVRLMEQALELGLPALLDLISLGLDRERRSYLFRLGVGEKADALELGEDELNWLMERSQGRGAALARATKPQVSQMLLDAKLGVDDLERVADRLSSSDGPEVAELLKRGLPPEDAHRRALGLYLRYCPNNREGLKILLPSSAVRLLEALHSEAPLGSTVSSQDLAVLRECGLLESVPARALAGLRKDRLCWDEVHGLFQDRLKEEGLEPAVAANLSRGVPVDSTFDGEPGLVPEPSWLRGLEPEKLIGFGQWAWRSPQWFDWWIEALRLHPDVGPHGVPFLDGEWSLSAAWRLRGEYRSGKLSRSAAVAHVLAWVGEDGVDPLPDQLEVFDFLEVAQSVRALLLGRPGAGELAREDEELLEAVFRLGGLSLERLVSAVSQGQPCALLRSAQVSPAAVALVDPAAIPPASPPEAWPPEMNGLLAQAADHAWFWERWPFGMPEALQDWIEKTAAGQEGGALVSAVAGAERDGVILGPKILEKVRNGLSCPALCRHVLAAMFEVPGRMEAIEPLLGASAMPRSLGQWLRLHVGGRPGPFPEGQSAGVLKVLLPLLHPVRDVLLPVLERGDIGPGEDALLASLLEAIRNAGCPGPGRPDRQTIARRPDWCSGLARLPGWSHWSPTVDTGTGLES